MLNETILLAQNKQLRERVEELEETVRQLRRDNASVQTFPDWLPHVTPHERDVLVLLYRREIVSPEAMRNALYGGEDRVNNLLSVIVHRLRKKLKPCGIEITNTWGRGYSLSLASKELLTVRETLAA